MNAASNQSIVTDRDKYAARQTADKIMHLLRDFIPEKCYREAWDTIAHVSYEEGYEFTSKLMRKEYEACKLTQLTGII